MRSLLQDVIAKSGLALARMSKRLGWDSLALSLAARTTRYAPESFSAAYWHARFLLEAGRHSEALDEFQKVMQRWPEPIGGYDGYAGALQELGRHTAALEMIDYMLEQSPSNADLYVIRGVSLKALDRTAEAVAAYKTALLLDSDNAAAHTNLGLIRAEQEDWAEASEYHQRAYELSPSASTALNLAEALSATGRRKDADALLRSLPRRGLKDSNLRLRMARGLWQFDERKSLEVIRDVVIREPNNIEARSMLSAALVLTGNPREALAVAERLVSAENSAPAYASRGFVHLQMKNGAAALHDFETAESLDPTGIEYVQNRGCALSLLGRHREALAAFQQVQASCPRCFDDDPELRGYYDASKEALETRVAEGKPT